MAITAFHQLVWIDHRSAKVFGVSRHSLIELAVIQAPNEGKGHIHHKAGTMGAGHNSPSARFLEQVATALRDAREILIIGPSDAKHALKDHLKRHEPILGERVIGVEAMDKCGEEQLQAYASLFFRQADSMHPPPS